MFDEPLPKQADLRKLTTRETDFKSHLSMANFNRLAGAVYEGQGSIDVDLHFGVDDQYIRYVSGTVSCETAVVCQRCLEPVVIQFSSDMSLGIVITEEQAKHLPADMDPLVVDDEQLIDLNEVVEEELLLSLPFVSFHELGECSGMQRYESVDAKIIVPIEKENPFKVLEQLKTSKE